MGVTLTRWLQLSVRALLVFAAVLAVVCGAVGSTVATPGGSIKLLDQTNPQDVAFIGDSYAQGYRTSTRAKRWTTLVSQRMGWTEHNFARGGTGYVATSSYGPNYLGMLDGVAATHPDIVVVSGGVNDREFFHDDEKSVDKAVVDTFDHLRDVLPNARIIAVGPTFVADLTPEVVEFNQIVQSAVRAVGGDYVSLIAPTPVLQQDMVLDDQLHVDDAGHAAIADRVIDVLTAAPNQ